MRIGDGISTHSDDGSYGLGDFNRSGGDERSGSDESENGESHREGVVKKVVRGKMGEGERRRKNSLHERLVLGPQAEMQEQKEGLFHAFCRRAATCLDAFVTSRDFPYDALRVEIELIRGKFRKLCWNVRRTGRQRLERR